MRVVLGLGCDRGTLLETLEDTVARALIAAGLALEAVEAVATIDRKRDEQAILALAQGHDWPRRFFSAAALSEVAVPHPSETVRRHMGTPAVAEAAAILAGTGHRGDLLLPKHRQRGNDGKHATVAIARVWLSGPG